MVAKNFSGVNPKIENPNKFYELYGQAIAKQNVAPIPIALFRYQKDLNLSFQELCFVCHLLSYRWTTKNPYPSIKQLSDLTGVSEKTLHSYKKSLVEKKLLFIHNRFDASNGQLSNEYDLTPLFETLQRLIINEEAVSTDEKNDSHGCGPNNGSGPVKITDPPFTPTERQGKGGEKITDPPFTDLQRGDGKNYSPGLTRGLDESNNNKDQLFRSSLRSDLNNIGLALQAAPAAAVSMDQESRRDSHPLAGVADGAKKAKVDRGEEKKATVKELIAELVAEYRSFEGVTCTKGDYAFIGSLYNQFGYESVLESIGELRNAYMLKYVEKPLLYLKAILLSKTEKRRTLGLNMSTRNKQRKKELLRSLYLS